MRSKQNAIADLVDLSIRLSQDVDQDENSTENSYLYSIRSTLRVSYAEMYCTEQNIYFKVSIKKLFIRLNLEGLDLHPEGGTYDPVKISGKTKKISDKKELKTEASLSGGGDLKVGTSEAQAASASVGAKFLKSWSDSKTVETQHEHTTQYVTQRPGERWEVHDPEQDSLNATYLTEERPLCKVVSKEHSNRRSAVGYVEISQKDLQIDFENISTAKKLTTNKSKLSAIVIAKGLSTEMGQNYTGKIFLCKAEDSDDQ